MDVKVGGRLRSVVCDTEVIAVRAPGGELDVRCGGHPMVAKDDESAPSGEAVSAGADGGNQAGKRYADEDAGVELLVTKAGKGTLALGDDALPVKEAKPLPASD